MFLSMCGSYAIHSNACHYIEHAKHFFRFLFHLCRTVNIFARISHVRPFSQLKSKIHVNVSIWFFFPSLNVFTLFERFRFIFFPHSILFANAKCWIGDWRQRTFFFSEKLSKTFQRHVVSHSTVGRKRKKIFIKNGEN